MLFWLFMIILAAGIGCIVLACWIDRKTRLCGDWLWGTGIVTVVLAAVAILISVFVIIGVNATLEGEVASNQQRYKSLTYQLENNLYDNDNDVGKKELYNEIREWNEDVAFGREAQDDFWIGIYIPDIFDQFEFIPYGEDGTQ